jgi:hypothetical protein
MKTRRFVAGAVTVAALAGGGAVAIAASGNDATEDAVLADAAKRLGVTQQELRNALGAAEDAQIDRAVQAGKLTQHQADELKQRRQADGSVLGLGGPREHGFDGDHHGFGPGGPGAHGPLDDVAVALGITERQLFDQLRSGKSLADVAKAHGKTLDDVRAAVKAAVIKRLDAAVKAGTITKAERDEEVQELDEHLQHLGERPPGPPPGFDRFRHP